MSPRKSTDSTGQKLGVAVNAVRAGRLFDCIGSGRARDLDELLEGLTLWPGSFTAAAVAFVLASTLGLLGALYREGSADTQSAGHGVGCLEQ